MGKQSKARRPENLGKGKVTPLQVAFIVDRYLLDNNYSDTRSAFRAEASSLISGSPTAEAPKSLLSLAAMLDEYIHLKEQRVILEHEKLCLEQEKLRVHNLLHGIQTVMDAYNTCGTPPLPPPTFPPPAARPRSLVMGSKTYPPAGSPAGSSMHTNLIPTPLSMPVATTMNVDNYSNPATAHRSANKRKHSKAPDSNPASKKFGSPLTPTELPDKGGQPNGNISSVVKESSMIRTPPYNCLPNEASLHGSSVAKSLFTRSSTSPPGTSSGPKTPHLSVEGNHNVSHSSPGKTGMKSCNKGDHVKGKLNLDGSEVPLASDNSASESDFDIDLFNLDMFGSDFCVAELLADFDVGGSPEEPNGRDAAGNGPLSELYSTVKEILSEKDMNIEAQTGRDQLASVRSATKSIRISSPAKTQRSSARDQENLCMAG